MDVTDIDLSRAHWRKSSRSGGNGECVEVARIAGTAGERPGLVAVRDSKDLDGPKLVLSMTAWTEFMRRVQNGGFDLA